MRTVEELKEGEANDSKSNYYFEERMNGYRSPHEKIAIGKQNKNFSSGRFQ